MNLTRRRKIAVGVIALAVVVASICVAVANASAHKTSGRASGIAATHMFGATPALAKVHVQASLPDSVTAAVQNLAVFDKTSSANAVAGVRLARPGADLHSTVYTFTDDRGNACVVVVGETEYCNPDGGTPTPGINWSVGGGDSTNPDRLIAIFSSNVSSVSLTADGAAVPVTTSNDIAYGEFPATTKATVMTVTYIDGSSRTINTDLSPFKG